MLFLFYTVDVSENRVDMCGLLLGDESDMKIVVLEGSPNKNGSSNLLASEFIRGAKEAGHFRHWKCITKPLSGI